MTWSIKVSGFLTKELAESLYNQLTRNAPDTITVELIEEEDDNT